MRTPSEYLAFYIRLEESSILGRGRLRGDRETYIGVDALWAIVFVVTLAVFAFIARADLGTDADTVTDLYSLHFGAYAYSFARDFMPTYRPVSYENSTIEGEDAPHDHWKLNLTPALSDGMDIGATDTIEGSPGRKQICGTREDRTRTRSR